MATSVPINARTNEPESNESGSQKSNLYPSLDELKEVNGASIGSEGSDKDMFSSTVIKKPGFSFMGSNKEDWDRDMELGGAKPRKSNAKSSPPPPFHGRQDEDITKWFKKLELYLEISKSYESAPQQLFYLLEGAAFNYFSELDERDRNDYFKAKELLINKYDNPNLKWMREQSLAGRVQKPNESVGAYTNDYNNLCSLLNRQADHRMTGYIRGLLPKIRSFVITARPVDQQDAETLAILKEQALELEEQGKSPSVSMAEAVMVKELAAIRMDIERIRTSDNNNNRPARTTDGRPVCARCNQVGHLARFCRTQLRSQQQEGYQRGQQQRGTCHDCGRHGHFRRDCPQNRKPPTGGNFRPFQRYDNLGHRDAYNGRPRQDRDYRGGPNNHQAGRGYHGGQHQNYRQQQPAPNYAQGAPQVNATGVEPNFYEQLAQAYLQGQQSACNQQGN